MKTVEQNKSGRVLVQKRHSGGCQQTIVDTICGEGN